MNQPDLRVLPPGLVRRRRLLTILVVAFVVALIVIPQTVGFFTDWLWFQEIGFESVFTRSLVWKLALFAAGAVVGLALFYGNIRYALSGPQRSPIVFTNTNTGTRVDISRFVGRLALVAGIIVAFATGVTSSGRWLVALQELHGVQAGTVDPLFGRDIGFYLFRLPALESLLTGLVTLTTLTFIVTGGIYLIGGGLTFQPPRNVALVPRAAKHLGALVAAIFVMIAVRLWFVDTSLLLFSHTGPFVGASYSDVHARLPALRVSAVVALIGSALVIYGALRGQTVRYIALALIAYAGVGIVGRGIIPVAVQRLSVVPNELARETPYLKYHLDATRAAWGLDGVTTRDLTGDAQLSMADIRDNAATIENVRLWERDLVQQTFGQLQEIRTYYDFVTVTDDRYVIDGRYRQVHLSAREVNVGSLPTRTFINEHLTFTHGMGITMAPVNQVTGEGLPLLFIKDLPPVSTTSLKLTRPQIYYGQLTTNYVFTGTGQKEFDYPAGDSNVETNYTGTGGVPIGSMWRRFIYAWRFGSLKIMLSNDIAATARVLYRREIKERARTALPFLGFDTEPYIMLTDSGELKWILDGYTGSERYPYAQRTSSGLSYMRNSVKVVIDAYNGTIEAYVVDPNEPIIRTFAEIFKGIFKPISEMPADVRRHIRFPTDLFRTQAMLQATYHMREPETFYHREDQWQIPADGSRDESINPYMRHIILRLPGEKDPEFIYMTPFTPRGKDNLAAWMVARMDGDHYGEMVVYRFPKQSLVYGPKQVANRINQDTEISRQLTLWDQRGSQVIRGELLVIPIEESLIYVQPIFLRAEGGTIPELKRVVVTHGNRVVMSETLEGGLADLFGAGAVAAMASTRPNQTQPSAATTPTATSAELIRQAQQHYDRAIAAQRAGNWAEYGREIDALGELLKRIAGR